MKGIVPAEWGKEYFDPKKKDDRDIFSFSLYHQPLQEKERERERREREKREREREKEKEGSKKCGAVIANEDFLPPLG